MITPPVLGMFSRPANLFLISRVSSGRSTMTEISRHVGE